MKYTFHIAVFLLIALSILGSASADQHTFFINTPGMAESAQQCSRVAPRPASLGDAFIAQADDINTIVWNPAGLSTLPGINLGAAANLSNEVGPLASGHIAAAYRVGEDNGIGLDLTLFNFGSMDRVEEVNGLPEIVDQFSPYLLNTTIGYGHQIISGLSLGAKLTHTLQVIDTESYSSMNFGFGLLYAIPNLPLRAGLIMENLIRLNLSENSNVEFASGIGLGLGISLDILDSWTFLYDITISNLGYSDNPGVNFRAGMEYWIIPLCAVRGGYRMSLHDSGISNNYPSMGVGVKVFPVMINYALSIMNPDVLQHQLGVQARF
jgi:hypothetical protein